MNDILENKYICQYCGKILKRLCDLTKHTKSAHLGYKYTTNSGGCFQKVKCEKCGREITTINFKKHQKSCDGVVKDKYIKNPKTYKYITDNGTFKCECGKEFKNGIKLGAHFGGCKIHREILGKEPKKSRKGINNRINLSPEKLKEIHKKAGKTFKERIKSGKIIPHQRNKPHTQEEKDKIRLGTIKYLNSMPNFNGPRYNPNACKFIDELNKNNNWNLQHALNGGEVCFNGYFVDGYDKELNIVFEYDEKHHYKDAEDNILIDKDIIRQNKIKEILNCKFYRYNEVIQKFYEV